ncbi:hypothetical protein [Hoeflea sp. AS16]|uniref:hypothetical protein n=1 Tax=Hoeflea sp. AS16 TaxID=3135779 RepID=UPI0031762C15
MRSTSALLVFFAFVLMTPPSFAASEMTGKWHANSSGGKLMLRVTGGKTQMKLSGSCNKGWITAQPADAFVLKGGNLAINNSSFKIPIGGECSTAFVKASKSGNGFRFSFRNKWRFSGSVK